MSIAGCGGSDDTPSAPTPPSPAMPALTDVSLTRPSVIGGESLDGTATISAAAPAGGLAVTLSSSDGQVVKVPATVTIAAGATQAVFAITTTEVPAALSVSVNASAAGTTRTATLMVAPPEGPAVDSLEIDATVVGGQDARGTVRLNKPARAAGGTEVTLTADDTAVMPESPAKVPEGMLSAAFRIHTRAVSTAQAIPIRVTAAAGGQTRAATIIVQPPPLPALASSFSYSSFAGDPIGEGRSKSYTTANATFEARAGCGDGAVRIVVKTSDGNWTIELSAPRGRRFNPGENYGATYPYQDSQAGIRISTDRRSCRQTYGNLTNAGGVFASDGTVRQFSAQFSQSCEGTGSLQGSIAVSNPPLGAAPTCP
jgi:hypothetical protein